MAIGRRIDEQTLGVEMKGFDGCRLLVIVDCGAEYAVCCVQCVVCCVLCAACCVVCAVWCVVCGIQ